jgi:hypothetical protein
VATQISPGHPVLDALIVDYRASLGRSVSRDKSILHVLRFWEIVAATTDTEAEALSYARSLHSLAIDHYQDNRPATAPLWNLPAQRRNRRRLQELHTHLQAAAHADRRYSYMVYQYPQVVRMMQKDNTDD